MSEMGTSPGHCFHALDPGRSSLCLFFFILGFLAQQHSPRLALVDCASPPGPASDALFAALPHQRAVPAEFSTALASGSALKDRPRSIPNGGQDPSRESLWSGQSAVSLWPLDLRVSVIKGGEGTEKAKRSKHAHGASDSGSQAKSNDPTSTVPQPLVGTSKESKIIANAFLAPPKALRGAGGR